MKTSIKEELEAHIIDKINDGVLTDENKDDWHFHCFNEDYYIIGYYQASQWLKKHGLDAFEAISTCIEYEKENFGEVNKEYENAEVTVNMLAYIYGEEVFSEYYQCETIEELREALED